MKELGETATAELGAKLRPLITAYAAWIDERQAELGKPDMALYQTPGRSVLERCREAARRIEAGLALLGEDENAAEAFRFANLAMWQQRVHSIISLKKRRDEPMDERAVDVPANRSWYPFQLAFILLNLPGITRLDHKDRSEAADAVADLLWFPTGGGKTEAYLGLSAYTMGLRRLQGPVAGRSGEQGVAVLMRYTLRLLTIQQFQRAAALICACEFIRRGDDTKWGKEPFRIGLWVGQKTTPNTTEQAADAIQQEHGGKFKGRGSGSPAQLTNCPWCGAKIQPGRDIKVEGYCSRHGFRSPEIEDANSHPQKDKYPPAKTTAHPLLRPPELIIQDELHLISGPLGTLVGHYETAVDKLCSWEVNGKTVRPKLIASTATIRKAGDQIHATFLRDVRVFPPNGLNVRDNFFALQRSPSEEVPGRRYVGICAPGRRLKVALIRVYVALLSAAESLFEKKGYGKEVDPWITLIGYFNPCVSWAGCGASRRTTCEPDSARPTSGACREERSIRSMSSLLAKTRRIFPTCSITWRWRSTSNRKAGAGN